MRRILLTLLLALAAFTVAAQDDVILGTDGTLYRIEVRSAENAEDPTRTLLVLSTTADDVTREWVMPATETSGRHTSPALAYDRKTGTVYVLWQRMARAGSGEVLLVGFRGGEWSEITPIANAPYHLRSNLKMGTTRTVVPGNGTLPDRSVLNLHAAWWDESTYGDVARYAMVTVDQGLVQSVQSYDLHEFVGANGGTSPAPVTYDLNRDIFRHPTLVEQPNRKSIDVIFGDPSMNRFQHVQITPTPTTGNGVLTIPIGVWQGEFDSPRRIGRNSGGTPPVSIMTTNTKGKYVFYFKGQHSLEYMIHETGTWSRLATVPMSHGLSTEAAVNILERMANDE